MELEIKNQKKIVYPYLPENGVIEHVPESNKFMILAKEEATLSNIHNLPNGAVIVSHGEVIGKASNKAPLSNSKLINLHQKYCIRHMLGLPTGKYYWVCPGCAPHSSHGEYRAVVNVQKKNLKNIDNPELYLWGHWWCCESCWNKMFEIGIKKVFVVENSEILFNPKEADNIIGKQFS
jgi:deoxycytidylate deaminase